MSLETDVQALTTATTDLLIAVNVSKATLDDKVDDAGAFATASLNSANASAASAATATSQATAAGTARTGAETARDAAVVAQNNAVAVVTGGTATLTPSATKIPLSDAQGKIAKGWLTNTDLVEQTDIGTGPNEIPLNQFLGELAYLDAQNIPTLGINVANAATANVTNLMQVTEISNAVPSLNLDFAKVKQLDPRITFTRASTGTYYDGKTVAKAEENLFIYSEDFTDASGRWACSGTAVITNSTVAPNATITADTLTATSGTSAKFTEQVRPLFSGVVVMSVYVKAGANNYVQFLNTGDAQAFANFDVTSGAGVVGTKGSKVTSFIVDAGSGWYRCIVVFDATVTYSTAYRIYIAPSASATFAQSLAAAGTETVFIWGAQLEQRTSATAYTPTTTQPVTNYIPVLQTAASGVPRFEHNPVTGESLGLEIEEQRANLVLRSEEFDNGAWTASAVTVTANTVTAPDGTLTADKLISSNSSGFHSIYQTLATKVASTPYTFSFHAKAGEIGFCVPNFSSGLTGSALSCTVNLSNGAVTGVSAGLTATTTSVGNGWWRIAITATGAANTTSFASAINTTDASGTASHTGNGFSGIYIWGAQLEAGAFPTSYIPTVASQVTRAADSAVMTGANFSSWYRQGEGTLHTFGVLNGGIAYPISIDNGSTSNYIQLQCYLTTTSGQVSNNGAAQAQLFSTFSGSAFNLNLTYKANDFAHVSNYQPAVTDALGVVPSVSVLRIGSDFYWGPRSSVTIKKLTYYPQRLSNAELVEMTA